MSLNKKVLLIIGGGISAYKSLEIIRALQNSSIEVIPVMTKSAKEFVTPLSVAALSRKKVHQNLFEFDSESEIGHIQLSRQADLVLVAPATANLISKMANGNADDLASTLLLATDKKVLVAPAMNVRMWDHPATVRNLEKLKSDGITLIGPNNGDMACGEFGPGRMAEPDEISSKVISFFSKELPLKSSLNGKKVLVTSGPTLEPIDPIRYISNHSSGKQGTAIADAFASHGADVVFITGPTSNNLPKNATVYLVGTATEMYNSVFKNGPYDIAVCTAAVSDWRIENTYKHKIKKSFSDQTLTINLIQNPDILKDLSNCPSKPKLTVGFAAETNDLIKNAKAKIKKKGCDWILANDIGKDPKILGGNNNKITLIKKDKVEEWSSSSKIDIAKKLVKNIESVFKG